MGGLLLAGNRRQKGCMDSVEEKRINNGFSYSDSLGVGANYSESWD